MYSPVRKHFSKSEPTFDSSSCMSVYTVIFKNFGFNFSRHEIEYIEMKLFVGIRFSRLRFKLAPLSII